MPTKTTKAATGERQLKMIKELRDSGAVDFDRLGKLVAKVTPQVFDPSLVATDYVASAYTSVIKIWETGIEGPLNRLDDLKKVSPKITSPLQGRVKLPGSKK